MLVRYSIVYPKSRVMDYQASEAAVRERIKQLQNQLGFTENRLADGDAPTQKRLNRQLSHGATITLDTLLLILKTYPNVSSEWLLKGCGNMLINNATAHNENCDCINNCENNSGTLTESFVRELLMEKDKQIESLLSILKNSK